MAVNDMDSMNAQFAQGSMDRTYIQIAPDRKNVENPPIERLNWPTYGQAEVHKDPPFWEAHWIRSAMPRERWTSGDGDTRAL